MYIWRKTSVLNVWYFLSTAELLLVFSYGVDSNVKTSLDVWRLFTEGASVHSNDPLIFFTFFVMLQGSSFQWEEEFGEYLNLNVSHCQKRNESRQKKVTQKKTAGFSSYMNSFPVFLNYTDIPLVFTFNCVKCEPAIISNYI